MSVSTTPLPGAFGAEIGSLEPHTLTEADRAHLNATLAEHGVLVASGSTCGLRSCRGNVSSAALGR
jgi:hypothetical protein